VVTERENEVICHLPYFSGKIKVMKDVHVRTIFNDEVFRTQFVE
jgi:hypothetical protein